MQVISNLKLVSQVGFLLFFIVYLFYAIHDIAIDIWVIQQYPVTIPFLIKNITYHYGLVFLIPLLFVNKLQKSLLFNWKVWIFPSLAVLGFSFYFLVTEGYFATDPLGLAWSNVAVITWVTLFNILLFLYQRFGVSLFDSFVASFSSVIFSTWFFELLNPQIGINLYFYQFPIYFSLFILAYLGWKYHIQKPKWLWVFAILALLPQLSYFTNYNCLPWDAIVRLFPWPIFIYYSYQFRRNKK